MSIMIIICKKYKIRISEEAKIMLWIATNKGINISKVSITDEVD